MAVITAASGSFREMALYYHEVGDELYQFLDGEGKLVPLVDPLTSAYRPGARAINYRSEPFMNRLLLQQRLEGRFDESVAYSSYAFGDPATPIIGPSETYDVENVEVLTLALVARPQAEVVADEQVRREAAAQPPLPAPAEPCDREGHARFDGEALETGAIMRTAPAPHATPFDGSSKRGLGSRDHSVGVDGNTNAASAGPLRIGGFEPRARADVYAGSRGER